MLSWQCNRTINDSKPPANKFSKWFKITETSRKVKGLTMGSAIIFIHPLAFLQLDYSLFFHSTILIKNKRLIQCACFQQGSAPDQGF